MNEETRAKKIIQTGAYILIIILIICVIGLLILKYDVEGEKNMPFKLSNIIVISNAQGIASEEENPEFLWNQDVYQNNDIYLNIEKNKSYKEAEIIKNVKIENIKINNEPKIGKLEFFRTSSDDKNLFTYEDEYKIENGIEYVGNKESDLKNLKISNQGGTIIIRVINKTGKTYNSNEEQFEHNGKLLGKVGIKIEDVKSSISFDIIISLESGTSFRANISLDIPVGDIISEGSASIEKNDLRNIVFKRE